MQYHHTPVLLQEVLQGLCPQPNQNFIDGTVGGGGHATAILQVTAPYGQLLAFDKDEQALQAARHNLKAFGKRVTFVKDSYANLEPHIQAAGWTHANGILLDLGLSSDQLADSSRGFSFQIEAPLDMRFDITTGQTAADILNQASDHDLEKIFRDFGEEPKARILARTIVATRKIHPFITTTDFLNIILSVKKNNPRSLHPATLPWQALRIAVNKEFDEVTLGLNAAINTLLVGGRLAVISFHSGEDRIVKNIFNHEAKDCWCPLQIPVCVCKHKARLKLLNRKPMVATALELQHNARARSAKLRISEKIF